MPDPTFTQESFALLSELRDNNHKEWFAGQLAGIGLVQRRSGVVFGPWRGRVSGLVGFC
jgi:hypothetical protein